ncbi:SDR family oxidoreductase [Streptomyces sp. NPDC057717]|uniref:SDR family oxidoreductase n=1 Tax=Streptomyces sp. NPDC057717 TaxID=3346224 RepID=UPI0036BD7DCE
MNGNFLVQATVALAMTFLVHGATGAQGSAVLSALAVTGQRAVAAVRDTSRVANAAAVAVDMSDPDSLAAAYTAASGVFVHLPLAAPEDQWKFARAVGAAVRAARPDRVVVSTSGSVLGTGSAPDLLVDELARSGVSYAVVEPRQFLDNLLLPFVVDAARTEGVLRYPLPADYVTSWTSHLDVADAVVRLLTDISFVGAVSVGALPPLDGQQVADGFSRYLGLDVRYEASTPDEFGDKIAPLFGEETSRLVADGFTSRQGEAGDVIQGGSSAQALLGLHPRTVESWLRDLGV